jgi:hypothetical protein
VLTLSGIRLVLFGHFFAGICRRACPVRVARGTYMIAFLARRREAASCRDDATDYFSVFPVLVLRSLRAAVAAGKLVERSLRRSCYVVIRGSGWYPVADLCGLLPLTSAQGVCLSA